MEQWRRLPGLTLSFSAVFALSGVATGCGGAEEEASDSADPVELSLALETVQTAVNSVGDLEPDSAGLNLAKLLKGQVRAPQLLAASGFGSSWTDASLGFPLSSVSGGVSSGAPRSFIQEQLRPDLDDNDAKANLFTRMSNSFQGICLTGILPELGSGFYPVLGTQSLTIDGTVAQRFASECGMQVDSQFIAAVDASPLDFDIVFSKPSDTTHYDIKSFQAENPFAGFAGPGDPTSPSTGFDRYNSREINMLRAEMEPGGNISRLMLEFDRTTKVLKMEYFLYAASGGDVTFYRLYLDQTNDIAKLFSYKGQTGAGDDWTRYTVVGKPVAGGTIAVSLDRHGSGLTGGYDRQACVTIADGAIASGNDNSLSCTLTGVDGDAAEAAIFPNGASALATEAALGVNSSWLDITETMSITWGADTIYTQAVSY